MRAFFHADDCGLTQSITQTIIQCLHSTPLASTSVMMNGDDALNALEALIPIQGKLFGVHLNILEGKAVTPLSHTSDLVDEKGVFKQSLGSLALLLSFPGKRKERLLADIHAEFSSQIALFRQIVPLTFPLRIDGHLHVHVLPALRPVLTDVITSYGVSYIRVPFEPSHIPPASPLFQLKGQLRRELLKYWSAPLYALLRKYDVSTSQFFSGAFASGEMTIYKLAASLAAIKKRGSSEDLIEIMVHPGGISKSDSCPAIKKSYSAFYTSLGRMEECSMLHSKDVPQLFADLGITLATSFYN